MEKEWTVTVPDALIGSLRSALCKSMAEELRRNGIIAKAQIDHIDGLKIEIFSREHPPPHFRVRYAGKTANFAIKDCKKLAGDLERWEPDIRQWHGDHKVDLIRYWNERRPSDCPVGEYTE